MERKEFLKNACALCGLTAAAGFLASCKKEGASQQPTANFTVDLTDPANADVTIVGKAILINDVYVVNKDGSNFIAVSSICTHQGCVNDFQSVAAGFTCPCHSASFTINGIVTGGPASVNLKTYSVTRSGNVLTVAG